MCGGFTGGGNEGGPWRVGVCALSLPIGSFVENFTRKAGYVQEDADTPLSSSDSELSAASVQRVKQRSETSPTVSPTSTSRLVVYKQTDNLVDVNLSLQQLILRNLSDDVAFQIGHLDDHLPGILVNRNVQIPLKLL